MRFFRLPVTTLRQKLRKAGAPEDRLLQIQSTCLEKMLVKAVSAECPEGAPDETFKVAVEKALTV